MASTLPMQFQNIKVYKDDEFLGYVEKVSGVGASVQCKLTNRPWKFPQRRATSILKSAQVSSVCLTEDGRKFYPRVDGIEFKMIKVGS